jgi:DNA invertase Pin-like site-specific DNA recombinase
MTAVATFPQFDITQTVISQYALSPRLRQLVANIGILTANKIRFVAISQSIDTDESSPTGRLLLHVLGSIAEFEREMISERVRSGVEHARRQGKHLGRPRKVFRRDLAAEMRESGASYRKIAAELGTSARTVARELAGVAKSPLIPSSITRVSDSVSWGTPGANER